MFIVWALLTVPVGLLAWVTSPSPASSSGVQTVQVIAATTPAVTPSIAPKSFATVTASPVALTFPPLAKTAPPATVTARPQPVSLESVIRTGIDQWKGSLGKDAEFGLVIHNLDTNEKIAINSQAVFETASLYKLFVMLTVFSDIDQGKMSLDDQIVLTPAAAEGVSDDGGAWIVPLGGSLAVRDLLNAMIVESNNTAGLMLLFQVRVSHMKQLVTDMGFKGTNLNDSYNFRATPDDFEQFFTRLANQKLLGPKYDPAMLDLLSKVSSRDRIPALLPTATRVAHKIGNVGGTVHDTGIVFLPNGQRLAITVMVQEADPNAARKFIAQLSQVAYNLYNNR